MSHYVAIVEDAGPEVAIGLWFPDLPGCFSAGDTVEEAMRNAPEAIELYAVALESDGKRLPAPRRLDELRKDEAFNAEAVGHLIALVEGPRRVEAAE